MAPLSNVIFIRQLCFCFRINYFFFSCPFYILFCNGNSSSSLRCLFQACRKAKQTHSVIVNTDSPDLVSYLLVCIFLLFSPFFLTLAYFIVSLWAIKSARK
jgi:hypothetical protein